MVDARLGLPVVQGGRLMTEYAVRESDGTMIRDGSWECVSDVVGSFHGGFAQDGRVTGVLLSRESPDDEWEEVDA
jgi:hypothetical protein